MAYGFNENKSKYTITPFDLKSKAVLTDRATMSSYSSQGLENMEGFWIDEIGDYSFIVFRTYVYDELRDLSRSLRHIHVTTIPVASILREATTNECQGRIHTESLTGIYLYGQPAFDGYMSVSIDSENGRKYIRLTFTTSDQWTSSGSNPVDYRELNAVMTAI